MSIKDIPVLIEQYATKRQDRLALQKQTDQLKQEETQLQNDIIAALKDAGMTSAGGSEHKVTFKTVQKPTAADWDKIYDYIQEEGAFDLLQRRLGETAVKLRWEEGIDIPGIVAFPVDKLSISKVS